MTEELDVNALVDEIRRYLAAVDVFRAEGAAPRWRAERAGSRRRPRRRRRGSDVVEGV
ncbi:MAG: hypothetical protein ACJ747_05395 [Gaiellaceae bacterium]|jgi:hypothetical protein